MVARYPCLEDYDRGNSSVFWAEHIAAAAHPCYDEYNATEIVPQVRTPAEIKADASVAEARYQAHRERVRAEEEIARAYRARVAAEHAKKQFARQAEERERSRVYEAERERLLQQRALEMERRAQWQREQEEWLRVERAEREAKRSARRARYEELRVGAKHAPALGSGNIVRVLDKNINIGSSIRMEVGEIWDVGDSWCVTLINDGYVVSVL